MRPFVVFAMPRSRSYWLSRYLNYGGWLCGHDQARYFRSLDDVKSWLAIPCSGTVETGAAPFWRLLRHYRSNAAVAVLRRPIEEVEASFRRSNYDFHGIDLLPALRRIERKLQQIEDRCERVLSLNFADLATERGCARIFTHCLPYRFDRQWWNDISAVNLQIDMAAHIRYYMHNRLQLEKLAKQAAHRIVANMRVSDEAVDGVTFHVETFASFNDAIPLFREHLVLTDQAPDEYLRKNLPVFRTLDQAGALQCVTARVNGRMFGYLVSIVSPSLDSPDETVAEHTIFFADPQVKNLGMRLQRAALEALRARGVSHVLMRAGHRGSGPRLGTVYRRLGAEPFGQLYRLDIREAA